jgi:hypothetical protein
MKPLALSIAALALTAAPFAAHAADVTFQVPVDISGFPPEVLSVQIECVLLPISPLNARATASVTLKGGAFKGTVPVAITIISAQLLEGAPKITSYTCGFYSAVASIGTQSSLSIGLTNSAYTSSFKAPADPTLAPPTKASGPIKLTPKP